MYLARYAKEVQIVVRRDSLREHHVAVPDRSDRETPNIRLRPRTEVERVEGDGHVERVALTFARRRLELRRGSRRAVRVHRHAAAQRLAPAARCCATRRDSCSPAAI